VSQCFFPGIYLDLRASLFRRECKAYGIKCKQGQIEQQATVNRVETTFLNWHKKGFKFIYLKRKNKLKQALSLLASKTRATKVDKQLQRAR